MKRQNETRTALAELSLADGSTAGLEHQYVMVVNGLALFGFALWPSVRNAYQDDYR
jgi:hypothetical protein